MHVQVVPGSVIGCSLSTKQTSSNRIGETPLPQRLLEIPEGWDLQIPIVYNFWNLYFWCLPFVDQL